jgi:hypothetical protein
MDKFALLRVLTASLDHGVGVHGLMASEPYVNRCLAKPVAPGQRVFFCHNDARKAEFVEDVADEKPTVDGSNRSCGR